MPLFTRELNALADRIGRSDLTIRLHTAAPTERQPDQRPGELTVGGAAFVSGANLVPRPAISRTAVERRHHDSRCRYRLRDGRRLASGR